MKNWTGGPIVAVLLTVLGVAACTSGEVGNMTPETPEIDEAAVEEAQALMEGVIVGRVWNGRAGHGGETLRTGLDPDDDRERIIDIAEEEGLSDAEINVLLDRMSAAKAARKDRTTGDVEEVHGSQFSQAEIGSVH